METKKLFGKSLGTAEILSAGFKELKLGSLWQLRLQPSLTLLLVEYNLGASMERCCSLEILGFKFKRDYLFNCRLTEVSGYMRYLIVSGVKIWEMIIDVINGQIATLVIPSLDGRGASIPRVEAVFYKQVDPLATKNPELISQQ